MDHALRGKTLAKEIFDNTAWFVRTTGTPPAADNAAAVVKQLRERIGRVMALE
jgi:hypothetical protein